MRKKGAKRRGKTQRSLARRRWPNWGQVAPESLTVDAVVKRTGIPVSDWIGDCLGIALAIADHGLVDGVVEHGFYLGPVHPDSPFLPPPKPWDPIIEMEFHEMDGLDPADCMFWQGYVRLPDGRVLDPTRWTFEMVPPYIWVGPGDEYMESEDNAKWIDHIADELRRGGRHPYRGGMYYCPHQPPRRGALLTRMHPWFRPLYDLAEQRREVAA